MSSGIDEGIRRLFAEGKRPNEIAAELQVSVEKVRDRARKLGLRWRATPAATISNAEVYALLMGGLSMAAIAERTGLKLQTVRQKLYLHRQTLKEVF